MKNTQPHSGHFVDKRELLSENYVKCRQFNDQSSNKYLV